MTEAANTQTPVVQYHLLLYPAHTVTPNPNAMDSRILNQRSLRLDVMKWKAENKEEG